MIFTVLGGKRLTFNGCTAIVEPQQEQECVATCDNSGRDIELVPMTDLVQFVKMETAHKEGEGISYADESIIEQQLAWTLTDFTKRTQTLVRRVVMDIQAGVRDYYITPPAGETVYRVNSVCVNGDCLTGYRGQQCCTTGKCRTQRGGFVFQPLDKIVLDEATCNDCGKIEVEYTTHVSNTACMVDKIVYERFQEAIVMGAGGRIRKMAGFSWSAPQKGLDMLRDYNIAITQYHIDDAKGHMNASGMIQTNEYAAPSLGFGLNHRHGGYL